LAQRETYWGLCSIVEARGYKPGWAAFKFKAIWWCWPRIEQGKMRPYAELQDWIEAERNKWKREKKKEKKGSGQVVQLHYAPAEPEVVARGDRLVYRSKYDDGRSLMADEDWDADLGPGLRRW